jgi:hypothetical protein
VFPRGDRADQPAPLPGRQPRVAGSQISEYLNKPMARARSARTRSSSWLNATVISPSHSVHAHLLMHTNREGR